MKTDSAIVSFIEGFPVSASFKEAGTGRYILNNSYNSRQFGVDNPKDLVGLTINDLKFCQPEWGAKYAISIEKLDFRARQTKSRVMGRHQFLDHGGEAQVEEMVKFPVLGSRGNILGIVTYRNDLTSTLSFSALYILYRHFYDSRGAIRRVLACLKIDRCFITLPTDAQLRVLLLKAERRSNKDIAKYIGASVRTVECHINGLRNKLVDGNLQHVLCSLNEA